MEKPSHSAPTPTQPACLPPPRANIPGERSYKGAFPPDSHASKLPGRLAASHPTDRLFFAVMPPPTVAERIAAIARDLREQLGLRGRPRPTGHLHVTLHHLGDFAGLPPQRVDEACTAAAGVALPSFEARFDRVGSFHGHGGKHPFVLLGGEGAAGVGGLYESLGTRLAAGGLARRERAFVPHLTLLYDTRTVAAQPIEPLGWAVGEFLLIHSLLGRGEYRVLGRWPLGGPRIAMRTRPRRRRP